MKQFVLYMRMKYKCEENKMVVFDYTIMITVIAPILYVLANLLKWHRNQGHDSKKSNKFIDLFIQRIFSLLQN